MNKTKIIIALTFIILVVLVIQFHPWHRDPVVFYEPVFMPLYVLEGDVLVTTYGQQIVFQEDKKVTSIISSINGTVVTAEKFKWFWEK